MVPGTVMERHTVSDPFAAESESEATPASQTPVLTTAQIEDMIARKAQEISDKRMSGFQSLMDRKIKEIADENKRISRSLAGTEDDVRQSDLEAELRRVERERDLLRVAQEHPEIAPYISKFASVDSPEDIAATLLEMRQSFAPPSPVTPDPAPAPAEPVPGVEPNNPPRDRTGWEPGTEPSAEFSEQFFKDLKVWPGMSR